MRERLSPTEQKLAYLIGAGIAIAIIAVLLASLGTIDNSDITTSLLLIGLALIVLGIAAWLILVKPWQKFDNLDTPQPTGHAEAEPRATPAVKAEPEAAPAPKAAKPKAPKPAAPAPEAPKAVEPAPAPEAPKATKPKPAPKAEPDDFTLIEGIGPKIAAALNAVGLTTFAQLAEKSPEDLGTIVKEGGVRAVGRPDTWPMQARLAADGKLDELEALKARIKGGVLQDE